MSVLISNQFELLADLDPTCESCGDVCHDLLGSVAGFDLVCADCFSQQIVEAAGRVSFSAPLCEDCGAYGCFDRVCGHCGDEFGNTRHVDYCLSGGGGPTCFGAVCRECTQWCLAADLRRYHGCENSVAVAIAEYLVQQT